MDCSPLGSSVHEILQARILEWIAMPFSRGSFQPKDWTHVSCNAGGSLPLSYWGSPWWSIAYYKVVWQCNVVEVLKERKKGVKSKQRLNFLLPSFFNSIWVNALYSIMCKCPMCVCIQLCLTLCDPMDYNPPGSSAHGIFPGKNTGVGCHFLF